GAVGQNIHALERNGRDQSWIGRRRQAAYADEIVAVQQDQGGRATRDGGGRNVTDGGANAADVAGRGRNRVGVKRIGDQRDVAQDLIGGQRAGRLDCREIIGGDGGADRSHTLHQGAGGRDGHILNVLGSRSRACTLCHRRVGNQQCSQRSAVQKLAGKRKARVRIEEHRIPL